MFSIFNLLNQASFVASVITCSRLVAGGLSNPHFGLIEMARKIKNQKFVQRDSTLSKYSVPPKKTWNLGPAYNYRAERDNVDNDRADRMREASDAHEMGAFGGFMINNWFVYFEFLAEFKELQRFLSCHMHNAIF
jgi:hypothetical protein